MNDRLVSRGIKATRPTETAASWQNHLFGGLQHVRMDVPIWTHSKSFWLGMLEDVSLLRYNFHFAEEAWRISELNCGHETKRQHELCQRL
jgi:hypothetical protein